MTEPALPATRKTDGSWFVASPGQVLQEIRRSSGAITKHDLASRLGLSRSAVNQRVEALLDAGLVTQEPQNQALDRGRPAGRFAVNPAYGAILVADTGATGMRTAVCDMAGRVVCEKFETIDITQGPERVLPLISKRFKEHLRSRNARVSEVRGIAMSVPGPVDASTSRTISPPIMTGWHNYDIPGYFAGYGCPVKVEKDTNAMVFGAHQVHSEAASDMVFVKFGTGIGTGLLLRGQLYRGADGAAGDVGHTRLALDQKTAPVCRCGNLGCVEAYAGGWAVLRDLQTQGLTISSIDALIAAVRSGNMAARAAVLDAAGILGTAVAHLVNTVNPRAVVLGGQLVRLGDLVLAAVREKVYSLSLPLATRNLTISNCSVPNPGVLGLGALMIDYVLKPDLVDQLIQSRS